MRRQASLRGVTTLALAVALIAAACGGAKAPPVIGGRAGGPAAAGQRPGTPGQPIVTPAKEIPPPPARGVLAGRVTSATVNDNRPVFRARVTITAEPNLKYARVALTDPDGRFEFTELPVAPNYVVKAEKTGFAPKAFGELPPNVLPTFVPLALDERRTDVNIQLAPQVFIEGKIMDEDGTPFAGAIVEALRATFDQNKRTLVTVADAISDDRGMYRLHSISPGQYYISAVDPAFANVGDANGALFYSPTLYPGKVFPDEATRLTVEPGVNLPGIDFKLQLIKPARIGGAISTTTASDGTRLSLLNGAVILSPQRNDQFSAFTVTEPDIRSDGTFLFSNVPPGRYIVQARGQTEREGVTLFSSFVQSVQGKDIPDLPLPMTPGAIVEGNLEYESHRGRVPPDNKNLRVSAPMVDGSEFGDSLTGDVGADGRWKIRGVMEGLHYLRVEGLPSGWFLKRVEYQGADITDIAMDFKYLEHKPGFRLILTDRVATIKGYVAPNRGDVLQGYAVVAFSTNAVQWRPQSRFVKLVRPDPSGGFSIVGLPPGEYNIVVTRDIDEGDLGDPRILDPLGNRAEKRKLGDGNEIFVDLRPPPIRRTGG